jgi:3-methyl-2-oxobutanoate hydroxymethyltransferase
MRNKITIKHLQSMKDSGEKIVATSVSHAQIASIADKYSDIVLVGDSLAMTMYNMPNTNQIDMDTMLRHTKSVADCCESSFVLADMPFGSYHTSKEEAFKNALLFLKAGASAVKLEVNTHFIDTVAYLVQRGIPVMAHLGLKPQFTYQMGGYLVQGKTKEEEKEILQDAKQCIESGVFSLLLEGVVPDVANKVLKHSNVPVIGIGASLECDGQILVAEDLLGLSPNKAKFVKQYADLSTIISDAFSNYSKDIKDKNFPKQEHTY